MIVSSQDFRNTYEGFYSNMRNYLWSFDILKCLGQVECDIYTAFIDYNVLKQDLDKLYGMIRETLKEDSELKKSYDELYQMVDDALNPEALIYSRLGQVDEVNPENAKTIRTIPDKEEEVSEI